MKTHLDTEVLFGSAIRGDYDRLSDRDLLLIDHRPHELTERKRFLETQGYSVAAYTWSRFNNLIQKKALFIQHLKQESQILFDENDTFSKSLQTFMPKASYSKELEENKSFFSLLQTYPKSGRGVLWAADVLYISLRNYGVLSLANEKTYIFSYERILEKFVEKGLISEGDKRDLSQLRFLKSIYRQGKKISFESAERIFVKIKKALPYEISTATLEPVVPMLIINEGMRDRNCSPYLNLRTLEKHFVALSEMRPSLLEREEFLKLKKWIEDPRSYASAAFNERESLYNILIRASEELLVQQTNVREYLQSGTL